MVVGCDDAGAAEPDGKRILSAERKIYLNGGYETAFIDSVSSQTWEYDPVADTFTDKAPSPRCRAEPRRGS